MSPILDSIGSVKAYGWAGASTTIYIATATGNNWVQFAYNNFVTDSSGNIYISGDWFDTISTLSTIGLYVHKYSLQGSREFEKTLSTAGAQYRGGGTGIDSSGNIYGMGAFTAVKKFIIFKYNNSGTLQWQKISSANSNNLYAYGSTTDSSGNTYVSILDDAGGSPQTWYGLLIKMDSTGAISWQKRFGTANVINYFTKPHIDSSGNIYVSGYTTAGYCGVTKYDSSGNLTWQRRMQSGEGREVTSDSSGNIYVASEGSSNQIFKMDSSGNLTWQRKLTAVGGNTPYARAIYYDNTSSSLYVAGTNATANNGDCFIAKYNSSGTLQWQKLVTHSSANMEFHGIKIFQDKILIAGQAGSTTSLVLMSLPSDGTFNGTYATPNNGTFTISNGTMTEAAGTGTLSTPTVTNANASFTVTNATLTQNQISTIARISRF